MKKEPTVNLPLGLVRVMLQSAYWATVHGDLLETLGDDATAALIERRQDAVDHWFVEVAAAAGLDLPTSDDMLAAALAAWARGSRPGAR